MKHREEQKHAQIAQEENAKLGKEECNFYRGMQ